MNSVNIHTIPNIQKKVYQVNDLLHKVQKIIFLDEKWKSEKSFEIEIKKSFLRGFLRYSFDALQLQKLLVKELKTDNFFDGLNFCTPFYPMIHLSEDCVEASGGYHNDYNGSKKFKTLWIPITKFNHSPISILKFKNKYFNKLNKYLIKLKVAHLFSKKLSVNDTDFYTWNGDLIHAGNFNFSNNITCAFQLKFTENIYEFEPVKSINSEFLIDDKTNILSSEIDVSKDFNLYLENINKLKNFIKSKDRNLEKILKFIMSLNSNYKLISKRSISFASSVLAQRIFFHNKFFGMSQLNDLSNIIDLYSILIGTDNLASLKRIENKFKNFSEFFINFCKKNKIEDIPYNSFQYKKIINKYSEKTEAFFY